MRRYAPDGKGDFTLEMTEGSPVARLLRHLKVPADAAVFIAVNGRRAEPDHVLRDGDGVVMFEHMEGG
jgi:sulfur carrier protein ThiS